MNHEYHQAHWASKNVLSKHDWARDAAVMSQDRMITSNWRNKVGVEHYTLLGGSSQDL